MLVAFPRRARELHLLGVNLCLGFPMLYLTHVPAAPLRDMVEYLWLLSDAPPHDRELIVPSGTLELVINLSEDQLRIYRPESLDRFQRYAGILISGPYSRPFAIDTAEHSLTMGVHFRPGGAFPLLGASVHELADRHVDAEALWGRDASLLRERLCSATQHAERFALLEQALLSRTKSRGRPATRFAIGHLMEGETTVRAIVSELGMSHRRFIELFATEVGMTPKLFSRVRRFQRIVAAVRAAPVPEWTRLAIDAGYFDQPHLVRDFHAFCGMPPVVYLRRRSDRVKENHVAMPQGTAA